MFGTVGSRAGVGRQSKRLTNLLAGLHISGLALRNTSPQSPIPTDSALIVDGTTTTIDQNFLAQFNLVSNTVSNTLGGAVALDAYVEGTANSGGIWGAAIGAKADAGFALATYPVFGSEIDVTNLSGTNCSDFGVGGAGMIGISLNGQGYRSTAAVYPNSAFYKMPTTAATAAGSAVLTFAGGVPGFIPNGAYVSDVTAGSVIPAGTTILSQTSTTMTMSANATGAGVGNGDSISFYYPLWWSGVKIAPHAVKQYGFWDASDSNTVLNATGIHTWGVDFSSITFAGLAIRLGTGAANSVGSIVGGTSFPMLYADVSGNTNISSSITNSILMNGSMNPVPTDTWTLGTATNRWLGANMATLSRSVPVTVTANYTVLATDSWIINNKSGSSMTLTLQAAASFPGRELTVKTIQAFTVISASSNVVPQIGGAAGTAILAATAGKYAKLVSDGTNWIIMESN